MYSAVHTIITLIVPASRRPRPCGQSCAWRRDDSCRKNTPPVNRGITIASISACGADQLPARQRPIDIVTPTTNITRCAGSIQKVIFSTCQIDFMHAPRGIYPRDPVLQSRWARPTVVPPRWLVPRSSHSRLPWHCVLTPTVSAGPAISGPDRDPDRIESRILTTDSFKRSSSPFHIIFAFAHDPDVARRALDVGHDVGGVENRAR